VADQPCLRVGPSLDGAATKAKNLSAGSSNGQQAVNIYLVLGAYIYMPVYHDRDVEAEREASAITPGILPAIVEFMSDVRSVVSVQNRRLLRNAPSLPAQ